MYKIGDVVVVKKTATRKLLHIECTCHYCTAVFNAFLGRKATVRQYDKHYVTLDFGEIPNIGLYDYWTVDISAVEPLESD